ncbi:MAG: DUF3261 domain-containing protein [Rhodospirillales bacterium]|nr:DUF3261 domain-containing protein [Rhodospirillales bacterium]
MAPGVELELPPPSALKHRVEAAQLVTARYEGTSSVFEGRLSVAPDRLFLVCTDGLGRRAMTIAWDGARLEVERAPWLPEVLPPENVLADIMLLFWPEEGIRRGLRGADIRVTPTSRSIRQGTTEVISITHDADPWAGVATLVNHARRYDIKVQSQMVPR